MTGLKYTVVPGTLALVIPSVLVASWLSAAEQRWRENAGAASEVAVASMADDAYCTPHLKGVVRRVAGACGLLPGGGGRGCQPSTGSGRFDRVEDIW
jgi:hypothetical protein